jgi:hypothetical protein
VPDAAHALQVELLREIGQVCAQGAHVVTRLGRRLFGIAEAPQVESNDRESLGERRHDMAPFPPRLGPTVQ